MYKIIDHFHVRPSWHHSCTFFVTFMFHGYCELSSLTNEHLEMIVKHHISFPHVMIVHMFASKSSHSSERDCNRDELLFSSSLIITLHDYGYGMALHSSWIHFWSSSFAWKEMYMAQSNPFPFSSFMSLLWINLFYSPSIANIIVLEVIIIMPFHQSDTNRLNTCLLLTDNVSYNHQSVVISQYIDLMQLK